MVHDAKDGLAERGTARRNRGGSTATAASESLSGDFEIRMRGLRVGTALSLLLPLLQLQRESGCWVFLFVLGR
jgi:hypothetical protein